MHTHSLLVKGSESSFVHLETVPLVHIFFCSTSMSFCVGRPDDVGRKMRSATMSVGCVILQIFPSAAFTSSKAS